MIKKFNEFINESSMADYFEVEYYLTVGQHGHVDSYPKFETAYKEALKFKAREEKEGNLKDGEVEYIGINSNTNKFAVLFVTKTYIKNTDVNHFSDEMAYNKWIEVANKCLETGEPQIGDFGDNQTKLEL